LRIGSAVDGILGTPGHGDSLTWLIGRPYVRDQREVGPVPRLPFPEESGSASERPIGLGMANGRVGRTTLTPASRPFLKLPLGLVENSIDGSICILVMMGRVVADDELMPRKADVNGRVVTVAMAMVVAG
jgi:hypothetical protein